MPLKLTVSLMDIVLMHGILGEADKITDVVDWIHAAIPCVYVKNVEIGNGAMDSVFMHMNDQVSHQIKLY